MKKSGDISERGPTGGINPGSKESLGDMTMMDVEEGWERIEKLVTLGIAEVSEEFGKDKELKSITVRDKKTNRIIYFFDMELLKERWEEPDWKKMN